MDREIHTILERLRLIESDITPTNVKSGLNKQQQSVKQMPALFKPKTQKILGGDASAPNPMSGYMVGGCEESKESEEESLADILRHEHNGDYEPHSRKRAPNSNKWHDEDEDLPPVNEDKHLEEESSEDMLTKVKASFADYLQNLEDNIKQDKDLLAKKKEDFDLKKKKMKDLELQIKQKKEEAEQVDEYEELEEDQMQLEVGDPICVIGNNEYRGEFGVIEEFAPSGKFVVVKFRNGDEASMHLSDVELTDDGGDDYDNGDDDNDEDDSQFVEGDTYAQGGTNTYAECVMPVVKTVTFEDGSECTIHGDEDNGFIIRRGEKQLPSKFDHLDHATMALDMYRAKKAATQQDDQSSDYVEEK